MICFKDSEDLYKKRLYKAWQGLKPLPPAEGKEEVCECNVRCIENCQSIQLGVEDLPVTHLEKNKYLIETYEEASVTCHQSCYDNLTKLGCEVNVQQTPQ